MNTQCRICNNSNDNQVYLVKEMMFGFPDEFVYFKCSNCGCLQISEEPADISKYYPTDYYSLKPFIAHSNTIKSKIRSVHN